MSGVLGNQFGFDRDGFRVFVLSPARRCDILLAKNLAVAPIALVLGAAAAVLVQIVYPMRVDQFLALAPRFVSMYLLYCLAANTLSIFSPMRIAPNAFQPARPGAVAIFLQILFLFLCPAVAALTLLPLGIEGIVEAMNWRHGVPLDLLLSLGECAVIVCMYGLLLRWQGDWLQRREQRILQIVTTRAD
jgi:ABC-2 type transport system permease protein